ncbi:hypothetical protein [[Clostridium] aminophilum]|uniref:Flavodoxin n=1 Tax=[Clostridium] aminophilum TaxID=1526 RepID=A0A1I6K1P6_9FIRM|nr:hypothetical protein [[Clostridium] aminophilum]SFR85126.1 Flavodoxin [[Clostridium] aminophilum]
MENYRELLLELKKMASAIGLNINDERFAAYSHYAERLLHKMDGSGHGKMVPDRKMMHDVEELVVDFSNSINEYVEKHHNRLSEQLYTRVLLTKGRVMSELFLEEHVMIRQMAEKSPVFRAYLEETGEPEITEEHVSGRRDVTEDPELCRKFRMYIVILNGISQSVMDPAKADETEAQVVASIRNMGIRVPAAEQAVRKAKERTNGERKYAVRYYTQSGNTRRIAEEIALELDIPALTVDHPLEEKTDVLFLCNSMYWGGADRHVLRFIEENAERIGKIVNVSTSALGRSTCVSVKAAAARVGVEVADNEFYCRGSFHLLHRGHPDEADLEAVRAFVKRVSE